MGREVVPSFAVGVNEVEPHIFYGVLRRRHRVIRMNGDVITAIDSQRVQGVEGARIERRRSGCLRCCHRKLTPLIGGRPIAIGGSCWNQADRLAFDLSFSSEDISRMTSTMAATSCSARPYSMPRLNRSVDKRNSGVDISAVLARSSIKLK
jgi:hypothetical protein